MVNKQGELFSADTAAPPWTRCFFRGDNLEVMRAMRGEGGFDGETYLFFGADNLRWLADKTPADNADIQLFLARCLPADNITPEFLDLYDWTEAVNRFREWRGEPPPKVPHPVARILRDTDLYVFELRQKNETKIAGGEPRRSEKAGQPAG